MSGVPQGSVLGPLLFILYVNEIPEVIQGTAKLFADDTKIFDKTCRKDSLQKDLDTLHTGQCKSTGGCYNELVVAYFGTGGGVKWWKR